MSKIIKKQIKRSMPWFLIFSLVFSSMVAGLVFNLNLDLTPNKDIKVSFLEAQAQNTDGASTTVRVLNAPPNWTVYPVESPVSTSTSPINDGTSMSFQATATDPEGLDYWLLVCNTANATANDDSPPTCDDTQFCVSPLSSSTQAAVCTDTVVDYDSGDPDSRTDEVIGWYAFICDTHPSEGRCQTYSQGTAPGIADASSPFYVNRAPTLQEASSTVDFIIPGGTYTVTATTTDLDTEGGVDEIQLDVCSTASWATSTYGVSGCSNPICTATGTISSGAVTMSCNGTTSSPMADQSYDYYAYIQDWHSLAGIGNYIQNNFTIINVEPVISDVHLHGDEDITPNLKWAPEVVATTSATVTDNNGCGGGELVNATSTIYWSNVTGEFNCAPDDSSCYPIADSECAITGCSGASANVVCTTTLAYNIIPTADLTGGNPATSTNWLGAIKVFDNNSAFGVGTTSIGVEVEPAPALTVMESLIDYAQLQAGQDTGTTTATTTIVNYGNTPLDVNLYGTDMDKAPDSISIEEQKHDLTKSFNYGSQGTTATSTSGTLSRTEDTLMSRPNVFASTTDYIYWGINIPGITPSGIYNGENTFAAVLDESGNWNVP